MPPTYVDLILPLAVPGTFTYVVPQELAASVQPGMRVVAPFGRGNKLYSAIVWRVHQQPLTADRKPRSISHVLDQEPVITAEQLALWETIANHYMCTLGEVLLAALPSPLVLSSNTRLVAAPDSLGTWTGNPRHDILLDALERQHELSLEDAGKLVGLKNPMPVIKELMASGALITAQELEADWKPRMVQYVSLGPQARDERLLRGWFEQLERAPKQLHLLMRYIELSRCLSPHPREVGRIELLKRSDATAAQLNRLVERGVLAIAERPAGMPSHEAANKPVPPLSPPQQNALQQVRDAWQHQPTTLLHGVTASGKTEIYMELMQEALAADRQVLYLLPEIALTTQIIARLRARFGQGVAVFHSRLSQRERTELWMHMLKHPHQHQVVVGARSALFLPFHKLGLVIVDEEHDPSFKQHDPAPRYNARDMALVLAARHGARTVLGSATPSLESMFNAQGGKYGLVTLTERFGQATLPTIVKVDLKDMRRRRKMQGSFSEPLMAAIKAAMGRREQTIIFQNRRGYVPAWQCETCGWIPECDHCDVSLTYHKRDHTLRCHYCGTRYTPPTQCAACGGRRLRMVGLGTEKVEEELALLLPEARVARMDQDTTRGKHGFEKLLTRFGQGDIDILVGTQMVTKGLDFDQVTVVGILNADNLMRFPDLRAHERAFQLMAQVAGRSGRKTDPGTVFIQARDIHHPLIDLVARHDMAGMVARELPLRQAHLYPPFSRMVRLVLRHRDQERVKDTAQLLAESLRTTLGQRVLGPEPPPVARVRNKHLRVILLKLERTNYQKEKEFLRQTIQDLFIDKPHSSVQLQVDVDPM